MLTKNHVIHTGFGNQSFEINCNNNDTYSLAQFLFLDFPGAKKEEQHKRNDILSEDSGSMLSLWDGKTLLYQGRSRYMLSCTLMNEVLFHCINTNNQQHALHAGAVSKGDKCIILPGKSGRGKSTLTAWLISHGFEYLTDELVFLADDGMVSPLTRPISLKENAIVVGRLITIRNSKKIISDNQGLMIPHRLLNPQFSVSERKITHIIFPEFKAQAGGILQDISPAKSCLYLVQSHVNARNLGGHGISELSNIVRHCKSYKLIYGSFDDLKPIFNSKIGPFS